jgi:hypothetical protein
MNIILPIPFTLNREEIKSQCAVRPGNQWDADLDRILDDAESLARPKAIYRISYVMERGSDTVTVEDTVFHSRAMVRNLEEIGRVFPFITTCGVEVEDTPIDHGDPLEAYWLSMIKLSLVRTARQYLSKAIQNQYRLGGLSEMNPGSGDAGVWPIEEQRHLFAMFGGIPAVEAAIGVRLMPTYLMVPEMSTSGILFPSHASYFNCQLCQREDCPSRKAPYDAVLWQSIQNS